MSSVYVLEPATRGRIVLRTTRGPIGVSLWADAAPAAVRSVLAHARSGYYAGTVFHRVVPGVLAQTGDPTRTGRGGAAAAPGGVVPREVHGRLKFRRRGLVALVGDEEGGGCRAQFFVTLGKCEWLDGKHTIFGTVDGESVWNALELESGGEVNGFDVDGAPVLLGIDVVDDPFGGEIASILSGAKDHAVKGEETKAKSAGGRRAVRSAALLSFGDDESDSEGEVDDPPSDKAKLAPRKRPRGMVSAHEVLGGGARNAQRDARAPVAPTGNHSVRRNVDKGTAEVAKSGGDGKKNAVAAAEQEFLRLQAELAGLPAPSVPGGVPAPVDASVSPPALAPPVLPAKFANLRRGVVRGVSKSRPDASRAAELRARVEATLRENGPRPLVFHGAATAPDADDGYETVDPRAAPALRSASYQSRVAKGGGRGRGAGHGWPPRGAARRY